jgi:transcriptional regulator with XRE-family HTH domain
MRGDFRKLRRARLALNIGQQTLAKKAGVPANYLCMFERGHWKLSERQLSAVETALHQELLTIAKRAQEYARDLVH